MRWSTVLFLGLPALLAPLAAQAQQPHTRQAILGAVIEFGDAIEAADAGRLRDVIWVQQGSIADNKGRDLFVKLILSQKRLERVAARFGPAQARFRCHFGEIFTKTDRAALATAEILLDLDSPGGARVKALGTTTAVRLRREGEEEGRWRVVLDILETGLRDDSRDAPTGPDEESQIILERYQAQLAALDEVGDRIEKGEYASAVAAETELVSRYEKAHADAIARLRASFSRRRSYGSYR